MDQIMQLFTKLYDTLLLVLPDSPFNGVIESLGSSQGIQWLNWFFPVGRCLTVFSAWLLAYAVYLLYHVVMRWIGLIQ